MSKCYAKNEYNGIYEPKPPGYPTFYPCSNETGVQQCCAGGDTCGIDGFCHFAHQDSNAVTGYYMGGCTDSGFAAAACPQHCTDYTTQDVVYNTTDGLWACCWGSGKLNCGDPSKETFYAPPVAVLFASSSSSSSSSSSTTTTLPASTETNPTQSSPTAKASSNSPSKTHSSSVTTIVIATVIPVVVIVLALSVCLWWWRRKRKDREQVNRQEQRDTQDPSSGGFIDYSNGDSGATMGYMPLVELTVEQDMRELSGISKPQEVDGRSRVELPAS